MAAPIPGIPVAFISSTAEDLKPLGYRAAAREAALGAKFYPEMMEYFAASGANPPLQECLERVRRADVVVAVVAWRYGWVPPDQKPGEVKSITWLECEEAAGCGKEVLAFLVDPGFSWPPEHREEYRLAAAATDPAELMKLAVEVPRNLAQLPGRGCGSDPRQRRSRTLPPVAWRPHRANRHPWPGRGNRQGSQLPD